jgi:hypothetical protein
MILTIALCATSQEDVRAGVQAWRIAIDTSFVPENPRHVVAARRSHDNRMTRERQAPS